MTDANFSVFLSNPIEYKSGVQAGFLLFPHSDENPEGWGEPFSAPDGSPIEPGTVGGPNANRLIGWDAKEGRWHNRRSNQFQCAGTIDWKGPWKTPKKTKRYVVSWNGPPQRYWNAGGTFVYDGNNLNHEVYMDGRIIAVAPLPVLGAALAKTVINGITKWYITVVCKDGEQDVGFSKPFGSYVTREKMTDEVRVGMQKLAETTYPEGWVNVGAFSCGDFAVPPETPWFFNELGTEARTMRRAMKEHTNEASEALTEMTFHECRFSCLPSTNIGSFIKEEPSDLNTFTWTETIERLGVEWLDPIGAARYGGTPHNWHEDHLLCNESMTGRTKVAVDWDLGTSKWVYGWITSACYRNQWQFWTKGTDPANSSDYAGEAYPPDEPPAPGDHTPSVWVGCSEVVKFVIGNKFASPYLEMIIGWGRAGSKSAMISGIEDSEDPYLYFWDSLDVHLHFVDLRDYVMAGYVHYDQLMLNDDDTVAWAYEKVEYGGHQIEQPYAEGKMFMRWQSDTTTFFSWFQLIGWTREQMEDWPETDYEFENQVTTYDMRWSNANVGEALWEPDFRSFYTDGDNLWTKEGVENTYFRRHGPSGLLYHVDRCPRDGVYGSTEKGQHMVCYRFLDVNSLSMATAQLLEPEGDIGAIVGGGDQFTPGGVV